MKKLLIAVVAILALTQLGGCDKTAPLTCTDDAFVMGIAAPPKPPAPKAPAVKAPAVKAPKAPVVKEPKRNNNGGIIVDNRPVPTVRVHHDDDCDDDD